MLSKKPFVYPAQGAESIFQLWKQQPMLTDGSSQVGAQHFIETWSLWRMWMIVVTKQLPEWTKMLGIRPEPSDAKCATPHYH